MTTDTSRADALTIRDLIADDAYAMSFQTMGQYRTALLAACDAPVEQPAAAPCTCRRLGDWNGAHHPLCDSAAPSPADERAAMLAWAVERWDAEVKNRPLINMHRRSLDDTWRQVIRHCGGDDVSLIGPRHGDLLAANPIEQPRVSNDAAALIVRDVCEMEPANPDLNDTVCIDVSDLLTIVKRHVDACASARPTDERAAFEAWYLHDMPHETYLLKRSHRHPKMYDDDSVEDAWTGWQARAASARILAAHPGRPEPRAEVTGWQPIETVPKDGTEVVLLFADEVTLLGKTRPRVRAASWLADWTIPYRFDNPPTHWMPLPAAPIDAARAGGA